MPAQRARYGCICGFTETVRQIATAALAFSALSTLQLLKIRKIPACKQKPDGSSLPGSTLNETVGFKSKDHLVHGGRAHAKVSLHIGLGGRLAVDLAVVVNEGEILTLFVGEGFCRHERSLLVSGKAHCAICYLNYAQGHLETPENPVLKRARINRPTDVNRPMCSNCPNDVRPLSSGRVVGLPPT